MDLSFSRPIATTDASLPAADMALLVALLSSRQEASATALVQEAIDHPVESLVAQASLAPVSGAFNAGMAARLARWRNQ